MDSVRSFNMGKLCNYVDVFMGTGKCASPKDGTLYSKWNNFKGKAGNATPAACLPFGAVSCNPYSGAYSSGYGNNAPNSGEPIQDLFVGDKLIGFAHFSHSGVGGIGIYYNYLLTVPFTSNFSNKIFSLKDFDEEKCHEHLDEYRHRCLILGENIDVIPHCGEKYEATALEILHNGALLVKRLSDGEEITVFSGEVSVRPLKKS